MIRLGVDDESTGGGDAGGGAGADRGVRCVAALGATAGATSGKVPRCEKVTVRGKRWGVYVAEGKVGCATAGAVLKGVLAGKGKSVDKGPANAYIVYDGWVCPYDQMGVLTCQHGTKPVAPTPEGLSSL